MLSVLRALIESWRSPHLPTGIAVSRESVWMTNFTTRPGSREKMLNKIQMYTFREGLDFMWSPPSFPFLGGLSLSLSIQNKMVGGKYAEIKHSFL